MHWLAHLFWFFGARDRNERLQRELQETCDTERAKAEGQRDFLLERDLKADENERETRPPG